MKLHFMHEYFIFMTENKNNCPKVFMGENSNMFCTAQLRLKTSGAKEIMRVAIFLFSCIIFMYENKKFQCMKIKLSCHDLYMHETFCLGIVMIVMMKKTMRPK